MKKILSRIVSILLIMSLVVTPISIGAKEKTVTAISNEKLEELIDGIITWARQGNDVVLNSSFLEAAGDTGGDWFPIGMGRYGYSKESYKPYLKKITQVVTERYKDENKLHRVKATEWHRISLAVLAMGGDPTSIGKDVDGKPINLIADGTYNFVGKKEIDGQGINGVIWALISVDSMNYPIPAYARYQRKDFIALILKRQLGDGGFAMSGKLSDPDITGMALQALAPYYDTEDKYVAYNGEEKTIKQVIDESLQCLSNMQRDEGDYYSWGTVNVESTVQVLTAVCSLGIDPYTDKRFIKKGKTLIDGILKYRCEDGGFAHSFINDVENPSAVAGESNRMATEQTLYGLVSYYRLKNGMRRLYDFRSEVNEWPTKAVDSKKEKTDTSKKNEDKSNSSTKTNKDKSKADSSKSDSSKSNTSKANTSKSDTSKSNTSKNNTSKTNTNKTNENKSNTSKTNTSNAEKTSKSQSDTNAEAENLETVCYESEIPLEAFKVAMGTKQLIKGEQKNDKDEAVASFTFYGEDIVKPQDFTIGVNQDSKYKDEILQLAKDAYIVHIEHEGNLPGETLLQLHTNLEDGQYLVFTYDPNMQQASYYDKISISDGEAKVILKENEEYFIAKGANMSSLKKEEVAEQIPLNSYNDAFEKIQTEIADNTVAIDKIQAQLSEIDEEYKRNTVSNYMIVVAIIIGCIGISTSILVVGRMQGKRKPIESENEEKKKESV